MKEKALLRKENNVTKAIVNISFKGEEGEFVGIMDPSRGDKISYDFRKI